MLKTDRVLEARTHGGLNARDSAVQTVSRVFFSVICDVVDTMRTHAVQCEDNRTVVHILELLDEAEMAFEEASNTWRAGIAVVEVQGEARWAFEAAMSCLVEGLSLM